MFHQITRFFLAFCWSFVFASCGGKSGSENKSTVPVPGGGVKVICECQQGDKESFIGGAGANQQEAELNAKNKCQAGSKQASVSNCELMTSSQT